MEAQGDFVPLMRRGGGPKGAGGVETPTKFSSATIPEAQQMSELPNSCNSSHKWYLAVCGMTVLGRWPSLAPPRRAHPGHQRRGRLIEEVWKMRLSMKKSNFDLRPKIGCTSAKQNKNFVFCFALRLVCTIFADHN